MHSCCKITQKKLSDFIFYFNEITDPYLRFMQNIKWKKSSSVPAENKYFLCQTSGFYMVQQNRIVTFETWVLKSQLWKLVISCRLEMLIWLRFFGIGICIDLNFLFVAQAFKRIWYSRHLPFGLCVRKIDRAHEAFLGRFIQLGVLGRFIQLGVLWKGWILFVCL